MASNEYPQRKFSWGNKKNINNFWLKKVPFLELWILTWSTKNVAPDKAPFFFSVKK